MSTVRRGPSPGSSQGVVARKRFGQHFLVDRGIIEAIVRAIDPQPQDRIVEIGPGTGVLTAPLLDRADRIEAVEIDRDLAARLRQRFDRLGVIERDVLTMDWVGHAAADARPLRLVGNLPYNISSPLLISLIPLAERVTDQHFMLQKEVVERMVAGPGPQMGRLSVVLQARYDMDLLFDVPPESFDPPPRVDSAVVRMIPLPEPRTRHQALLGRILAASFMQRRKMLRNSLGRWLVDHAPGFDLPSAASRVPELQPVATLHARPESIPVATWCALADAVGEHADPS